MKRFPEETVKFYAVQVIIAIGYLHEQLKFAHRDIKLENTLLDEVGYIKIIDYGLAKKIDPNTLAASVVGTPEYMAPEIIRKEGHSYEVDWWSIGILLYEMQIGVTPFYSKNPTMIAHKIQNSSVIWPDSKKYGISVSNEFKDFIIKLL